MTYDNKVLEIIRRHNNVYQEIERRDVVFRFDFDQAKRRKIFPYIYGIEEINEEENKIWTLLGKGEITETEAIENITNLLEKYYGIKYTLR